jgi:hypothetical protein
MGSFLLEKSTKILIKRVLEERFKFVKELILSHNQA